jgi:hypothetical protein
LVCELREAVDVWTELAIRCDKCGRLSAVSTDIALGAKVGRMLALGVRRLDRLR